MVGRWAPTYDGLGHISEPTRTYVDGGNPSDHGLQQFAFSMQWIEKPRYSRRGTMLILENPPCVWKIEALGSSNGRDTFIIDLVTVSHEEKMEYTDATRLCEWVARKIEELVGKRVKQIPVHKLSCGALPHRGLDE